MSVINRVLKDLDRQGSATSPGPSPLPGVRSVDLAPERPARGPALAGVLVALLVTVGAAAWWLRSPEPSGAAPASPTPSHATTPVDTGSSPSAASEPRLRMDQELRTLPASASRPQSPPVAAARPTVAAPPTPAAAAIVPTPRLDTRLSEPSSPPAPRVVKDMKPQTPAQQAEALWQQAQALGGKGRSQTAQPLLEQALQLDPGHIAARQSLVLMALETGHRPRAETLLQEGMALHPGQFWFTRSLAQLHIQAGDPGQAVRVLKPRLTRQSEAGDWALYAGTLAKLNRPEETAAAWREALNRDPGQGAWWIGLGLALEQGAHPQEARDAFNRALQTPLTSELRDYASRKAGGQ
ncbi:MAG: tetratricopeptide repeat protein [Pseudomonadota bacterium]